MTYIDGTVDTPMDTAESQDEAMAERQIAAERFDRAMERGELDDEYAEYLTRVSNARIGNGTMLIGAMENFVQYEEFKEWSIK